MKRSDAFPSQFLSKDDVASPVRATVADVVFEDIKTEGGQAEQKAVMSFRERDVKKFIINQTNWLILEECYGADSDDWKGKPVEFFLDPMVMFGGKRVGGVRVRIPNGAAPSAPAGLPWADALKLALSVNMSAVDLKEALKARGKTGYNSVTDADLVREIVAAKESEQGFPDEAEAASAVAGEATNDIPFN